MKFTVRAGTSSQSAGGFAVTAMNARDALDHVARLVARGLTDVHVMDDKNRRYDLVELERLTAESLQADANRT
jgi:hypothetical protein